MNITWKLVKHSNIIEKNNQPNYHDNSHIEEMLEDKGLPCFDADAFAKQALYCKYQGIETCQHEKREDEDDGEVVIFSNVAKSDEFFVFIVTIELVFHNCKVIEV